MIRKNSASQCLPIGFSANVWSVSYRDVQVTWPCNMCPSQRAAGAERGDVSLLSQSQRGTIHCHFLSRVSCRWRLFTRCAFILTHVHNFPASITLSSRLLLFFKPKTKYIKWKLSSSSYRSCHTLLFDFFLSQADFIISVILLCQHHEAWSLSFPLAWRLSEYLRLCCRPKSLECSEEACRIP